MRYVAAYLLAALNNDAPSKADVTKILESVGLDIDDERLDKVVTRFFIRIIHIILVVIRLQLFIVQFCFQVMSELKGKVLSEVIAEGMGKLASMPSGKGHKGEGCKNY